MTTTIETLIVGAGQAGLALSRELTLSGRDHVVVERGRVGERWRTERWRSLALLTPNWANRLPGARPVGDPDAFLSGAELVGVLKRYAASFGAPVVEGCTVRSVARAADGEGFAVETDRGAWHARNVVVSTGDCDVPRIPAAGADLPASVHAIHSRDYRAPGELPEGGVLVVGAGSSGHQIALELAEAGRPVVLAVGGHARAVRRYRGRDLWAWLRDLGQLDRHAGDTPKAARRSPGLPLDGRNGGQTIDLRVLADAGVTLAGRLTGVEDGAARFGPNLVADIVRADARLRALLDRIDRHIEARGADAPPAEPFRAITPPAHPPASLDLAAAGLGTVIWATGFRREHPWLHVDVRDREGELLHERGVTRVPGLYFLGLRWQHTMTSHQLGGVGRDAAHLAAHMAAAEAPEALAA